MKPSDGCEAEVKGQVQLVLLQHQEMARGVSERKS